MPQSSRDNEQLRLQFLKRPRHLAPDFIGRNQVALGGFVGQLQFLGTGGFDAFVAAGLGRKALIQIGTKAGSATARSSRPDGNTGKRSSRTSWPMRSRLRFTSLPNSAGVNAWVVFMASWKWYPENF